MINMIQIDEDDEKFKHYTFFVNSFHHVYLDVKSW